MHIIICNMNILSKNKADLLGLFFTNPENSFYIQEIGRILGKNPGTFQRTLNNLISEGILTSEYRGNLRFRSRVFKGKIGRGALNNSLK